MDLEDRAVRIANLAGIHWHHLDECGKAYYRRLAEDQAVREKRPPQLDRRPTLMPPFKI